VSNNLATFEIAYWDDNGGSADPTLQYPGMAATFARILSAHSTKIDNFEKIVNPQVGQYVECFDPVTKIWFLCRIVNVNGNNITISWCGWDASWNKTLDVTLEETFETMQSVTEASIASSSEDVDQVRANLATFVPAQIQQIDYFNNPGGPAFVLHRRIRPLVTIQQQGPICVVTKVGGAWWVNSLSHDPVPSHGIHRYRFHIRNCAGQYCGIGVCTKAQLLQEHFLGQNSSSWCLVTSKPGHPWDGTIFHNEPNNVGKAYAPPASVGTGSVIDMIVNMNDRTISFSANNQNFGVAFTIPQGVEIHVAVSMFLPDTEVAIEKVNQ